MDTYNGPMASNISVLSKKISAMDKENSYGKMAASTTESGFAENKVELECTQTIMASNARESGLMAKGKNGSTPEFKCSY